MRSPILTLLIAALSGVAVAQSPATPQQQLVNEAIVHEHAIVQATNNGMPLVETYLQFYTSFDKPPVADSYSLSELTPSTKLFSEDSYTKDRQHKLGKLLFGVGRYAVHPHRDRVLDPAFADMLSPDERGFNRTNYRFKFVCDRFLGGRLVAAFNVFPRNRKHSNGRFLGRIWIDEADAVIVRFTGVFESHSFKKHPQYLHFDSWRERNKDGVWRPYAIYIQDDIAGHMVRGQSRIWAYNLNHLLLRRNSVSSDMYIENAEDQSATSEQVSPLQAARLWRQQAAQNVIDRLEHAGLLAEPGHFDKILDQIVTNIEVPNNLDFSDPVRCRILLTTPIEATVIDHTILLSRGLINTIPNEQTLASVLAMELAHIKLGHRFNTMFAFSDETAFRNDATYSHLNFAHTTAENRAAAKLAVRYLKNSLYAKKLASVAVYYSVLQKRGEPLKALNHAYLGDSMLSPTGQAWLSPYLPTVTRREVKSSPSEWPTALASVLSIDPSTGTVSQILPRVAPGPGETPHSLEVLPVWLNLNVSQHSTSTSAKSAATGK